MNARRWPLALTAVLGAMVLSACAKDDGGVVVTIERREESLPGASARRAAMADGGADGDPLEIFLEAARTDVAMPDGVRRGEVTEVTWWGAKASLADRYREAARPFLNRALEGPAEVVVAEVLSTSKDERAHRALMKWVAAPETQHAHRLPAFEAMLRHPRAEYIETVRALLANAVLAEYFVQWESDIGVSSFHAAALRLALELPGDEGRALVRRIANDRAATAPNPRTLAAFQCPKDELIVIEAWGLASLRVMALTRLGDKDLLRRVERDQSEPSFVRAWARVGLAHLDRPHGPKTFSDLDPFGMKGPPYDEPGPGTPPCR
jgi:hypothetical protein